MQKLQKALANHAEQVQDTEEAMNHLPLVVAAKEWASHSLDTYSGELLKKALAVSAALREFADEYHTCAPNG